MLRAENIDDARATAALFTREEAGEPEQHLRDMQASWYELEVGSALARRVTTGTPSELRELAGPALKLFLSVEKHFSDFVEDQFDFHTYCVRKMTLRAYVSVLKLEDNIRGHKAFVKACCQAAELYLLLHKADSAEVAKPQEAVDPKLAKALAKREKAKAAKAKRKAEADAKAAEAAAKSDETKKKLPKRDADEDPKGEKLAALEPLKEATRLSKALEKYAASSVETHALAFDVSMVREKPLLALRALRRLSKQSDQRAFVVRLARLTQARPAMTLTATVASVLDAELKDLSGGDCVAFVRGFAARRPLLRDRSAAARALHVLGVAEPSLVLQGDASHPDMAKPLPVRDFAEALAALQAVDATAAASFREECQRRFPGADFLNN
jgi:peptide alpha-N-acetyltransferase